VTLCCPCCPSRSLHLAALAAPNPPCSSPGPTPTPITFVAPAGCSPGSKRPLGPACGLPAGCLPPQRCLLLERCFAVHCWWPYVLGPCCSSRIPARAPLSPACPRGTRRIDATPGRWPVACCVPGAVAVQSDRERETTHACVGRASGQSLRNETGQTAVKSSSMLPWGHSGPSDSHHKALLVCFNLAFLWPV
jgi:hypothetical protein